MSEPLYFALGAIGASGDKAGVLKIDCTPARGRAAVALMFPFAR